MTVGRNDGWKEGMMDGRNEGKRRQIQYSPNFSKEGYNYHALQWHQVVSPLYYSSSIQ